MKRLMAADFRAAVLSKMSFFILVLLQWKNKNGDILSWLFFKLQMYN